LKHGVSKDYDRVRWVYQYFYENRIPSMSWKDFQKTFQWASNSPLFTQVRQNRPNVTMEDLERWMEEYREKAKEYQNYELEYDKYQNKDTSYRNVEQLVLKINQSASAAEIIGEDEQLKFFLGQVAQGSVQSGHPVSANTVGWLRVDFINDQWLLVDEVQSDLINGIDLAKRFISEPNLETLMQGYRSETVKQKIRDMGATEQMFQHSKREFARRGYTVERLDEMRASLVNLFKDWAEYGIASLIEIARRQGIKNVAIHTGQSIAKRDPDLEADKAVRFYDQIAKAFGFKKQQVDVGDLSGEFWVRTASLKPTLWILTAGKRDQAITSATVGMDDFSFPTPVLIRWEQGMRWRQVLKAIKAVVGEIVGKRVAWRNIHLWESLWENRDEQDKGWEEQKSKGKVMFDILHNGSFVSVGAPYQREPFKYGKPEPEMVGYTDKEADSHKVTPEEETYYNNPAEGEETNAYANIPERVRGQYDIPSLETLLGKTSAEVVHYTLDIYDSHRGELFGKVEAHTTDAVVGYVQFSEATADIPVSDTRYWTEEQDEYGGQQWAPADDFPREVHIKYVFVQPEYRRKGVGTGMYEKIKQEFPDEKIVSSGTTDGGGKFRNKLLERGVLSKLKSAGPQGAGLSQHTNHQPYGMSKALKSDPFAVEREELALSKGGDRPAPNPSLPVEDSTRKLEGNGGGGFSPSQDMNSHLSSASPVIKEEANSLRLEVGGQKIGYIGYRVDQVGKKKYAEISGLEVDPAWRRQGWGTKLYEALAAKAKREGISFLTSNLSGMTSHEAEGVWTHLIDKGYNIEEVDSADSETGKPYFKWKIAKSIGPVYHGTGEAFEEYHTSHGLYYFTDDPKYAELFTNRIAPGKILEGANIRRAYITMNHPFDARSWGNDPLTIDDMVEILGMEPDETLGYNVYQGSMPFWQWLRNYQTRTREILREQGYDGIIQKESHPGVDGDPSALAYIVFNTNQIKWTMAKEGAGPVQIDWKRDMYKNFKFKLEYGYHEYGDPVEDDKEISDSNWNQVIVYAFDTTQKGLTDEGKFAGAADFVLTGGDLQSANTEVKEEYRRQGLATAMYVYVEGAVGNKTIPHTDQSDAGYNLWKQKGRPFGQNA
jgi:GNAT superfamily N-acetyltransferase